MTSYSIPYVEHIDSNIDSPAVEGDNSTKSSEYIKWLTSIVPNKATNMYVI